MTLRKTRSLLAVGALALALTPLYALDVPFLSGRVVDTAGLLSPETAAEIEALLKQHEAETSNQVVVLTVPSLEGEILEEYSLKAAETWKLGQAGKDNGVLLLIAKNDRKLRIEVGYGLEGNLTDALCNRIIELEITPRFKQGDFDGGVRAGVDAILGAIAGTYTPDESSANFEMPPPVVRIFVAVIFFLVVGLFTVLGVLGGKGTWFLYFFLLPFYAIFPLMFLGFPGNFYMLGAFVVLFPLLKLFFLKTSWGLALRSRMPDALQNDVKWNTSSSSGWSGGGSSGGFSGGGGSFGGGGSSGSW